jgi:outer membrane receptor protein involved in Fe transport
MLAGVPAYAQTGGGLETVIVTAEKRSEDLQKVPVNVTALTSEKLDALNVTNFNDFSRYMPSVTYSVSGQGSNGGPGLANITMRGIVTDQNGNHSGPLPTAGVYFDEQPITNIGGTLDIPTFDIERVEALSGPQGTLYGASSLSGTIRIISNKPDPSGFAANIEVGTNTIEKGGWGWDTHGMVNVPLADNMAVRLVAWDEHDAGYIDNVPGTRVYDLPGGGTFPINNAAFVKNNYNTVDKIGGRAALRIDLNDSWTITPAITAQSEKSNGFWGTDPTVGDLAVKHYNPETVKDTWYQASLTAQGKIFDLDLVYSGGYMLRALASQADYSDYTYWYDQLFGSSYAAFYDGLGANINPSQVVLGNDGFTKQSHEFRISTPKENRWRLTAGAFYEAQTHKILQNYTVPGYVTSPSAGDPVTGWPSTVYLADEHRADIDRAVFADAAFDITDNLTLNAGIRFFNANNALYGFFGFHSYESPLHPGAHCGSVTPVAYDNIPCTDINNKSSSSGETHRVNLTWNIDEDKMIYGTISTGFRPGGANRVIAAGVTPNYAPDTLTNYEVGAKTSWLDNRLRVNGALYWEEWKNIQFSFLGPNSITIVQNAGGARVKGVEFDLSYLPIDGLTLSTAGAYNDAQLTQPFCQDLTVPCINATADAPIGTQLPITPRWKINGTARYDWALDNGLDAHIQASMVHQSGIWSDLRTQSGGVPLTGARYVLGKVPGSTTFDAAAGIMRDDWALDLYVKNLADERAQLGRFAACTPYTCGAQTYPLVVQPRTFGLKLTKRFGNDVGTGSQ